MTTIKPLQIPGDNLPENGQKMPVLFIGHGNLMNAIEDNEFTLQWRKMGKEIPTPKAVLCISAHWLTKGTYVTAMKQPRTIHDFGGFPQLSDMLYPAPGDPLLAKEIQSLVHSTQIGLDHEWGLDHGSWSVLKKMYPDADIPVLQLSIDYNKPGQYHYDLGKELASLRNKGVLIIGSGNMVHNISRVTFNQPSSGYDWALEVNEALKNWITSGDHASLIGYEKLGNSVKLAIPTPDHYYPLLYTLGLQEKNEKITFFNDKCMFGSLSMTSFKIG